MESKATLVHIGAGKLGLGLIVPLLKKTGLKVWLLNRDDDVEKNKKLFVKQYKILPANQMVNFDYFDIFNEDDMDEQLIGRLSQREIQLITTSVTEHGLSKVAKYLSKIARKRMQENIDSSLVIIACENIHKNSKVLRERTMDLLDRDQKNFVNAHFHFCNCVVDRVCNDLKSDGKLVEICAHEPYSWKIDISNIPKKEANFLENAFGKSVGFLNKQDFQFEETLKLWCFNGMQLILAAYAKNFARDNNLSDYPLSSMLQDVDTIYMIHRIQYVFTVAMTAAYGKSHRNRVKKYHKEFLERIAKGSDDMASRIIHDLHKSIEIEYEESNDKKDEKGMTYLVIFLEKMKTRIVDPVEIATKLVRCENGSIVLPKEHLQTCSIMYSTLLKVMREEIASKQ